MSPKRLDYLKKKMSHSAAIPLVVTCLAPPPFPFTAVIAAASAFQYPKSRLLGYVFAARAVRFTLIGLAAIRFGRGISPHGELARIHLVRRWIFGAVHHWKHPVDHALDSPEPRTIGESRSIGHKEDRVSQQGKQ
jgi:hypothetical protein